MLAGLFIVVPLTLGYWAILNPDWMPKGIVGIAVGFCCLIGVMWLYDELIDVRKRAQNIRE